MTRDDRRDPRLLALRAAALLAAGGLGVAAAPAAAHEPAGAHDKAVTRVIVVSKAGERPSGEHRRFRIVDPDGDGPGCARTEVNDESEKTRVVVCGDESLSAADRAARLEKALARIQDNEELSAEHKARVTAALREAIDRLHETR